PRRNISMLMRYDSLEHIDPILGNDSIYRLTSGFNIGLPGGSLLMINHELWQPRSGNDVDVVGIRWSVSL
ncbi:MAG: hypothetical protein KDB22_21130, partial [Planctomycetales bacterium]|nr:hypothetical protein [Planctomycetales bacterium]